MSYHYEEWNHKNQKFDENYEGPKRQSNSPYVLFGWDFDQRYRYIKSFDMCKWLAKQVGRKWSDIYSELCEKYRKPEQRRLIDDHLFWVEQDSTKNDKGEFFDTKGKEITWPNFAVVDDILYRPKNHRGRWNYKSDEQRRNQLGIYHVNNYVYALIKDIWYQLIVQQVDQSIKQYYLDDKFVGGYITSSQRKLYYADANLYCIGKRQLNSKEIKNLGLFMS